MIMNLLIATFLLSHAAKANSSNLPLRATQTQIKELNDIGSRFQSSGMKGDFTSQAEQEINAVVAAFENKQKSGASASQLHADLLEIANEKIRPTPSGKDFTGCSIEQFGNDQNGFCAVSRKMMVFNTPTSSSYNKLRDLDLRDALFPNDNSMFFDIEMYQPSENGCSYRPTQTWPGDGTTLPGVKARRNQIWSFTPLSASQKMDNFKTVVCIGDSCSHNSVVRKNIGEDTSLTVMGLTENQACPKLQLQKIDARGENRDVGTYQKSSDGQVAYRIVKKVGDKTLVYHLGAACFDPKQSGRKDTIRKLIKYKKEGQNYICFGEDDSDYAEYHKLAKKIDPQAEGSFDGISRLHNLIGSQGLKSARQSLGTAQ